jgi:hypothetical protein
VPAHSIEPLECVVLGVDTAQVSGFCLTVRGHYFASDEFDVVRRIGRAEEVCMDAIALGVANKLPVVLVYEKPFHGTGQGQYVGLWKAAFVAAGGVQRRMVGVMTSQWRARILGAGWARAERQAARRAEQSLAADVAGRAVGGDEAPAILIARWGSHAGQVLKKLPKSKQARAA